MKQIIYYSLPLFGNQFKGDVYSTCQLSAKFQIWCRQFGVTDLESLAMWVAGDDESQFSSPEKCIEIAKGAYKKLPVQTECIDVTEMGKDDHICFAVTEITFKEDGKR